MREILDLFREMSMFAVRFTGITMQQSELDKQWNNVYQIKAQHILNKLHTKKIALPFELTEAKEKQLTEALTPLSPALLLKLHPGLAKRMRKLEEEDKPGLHTVCSNLSKMNDAMGELGFYSLFTNEDEPLMGAALLAAIKSHNKSFQQAGISFITADPAQQAAMFQQNAILVIQKEAASKGMEALERQIKDRMKALSTCTRAENPYLKIGRSHRS